MSKERSPSGRVSHPPAGGLSDRQAAVLRRRRLISFVVYGVAILLVVAAFTVVDRDHAAGAIICALALALAVPIVFRGRRDEPTSRKAAREKAGGLLIAGLLLVVGGIVIVITGGPAGAALSASGVLCLAACAAVLLTPLDDRR